MFYSRGCLKSLLYYGIFVVLFRLVTIFFYCIVLFYLDISRVILGAIYSPVLCFLTEFWCVQFVFHCSDAFSVFAFICEELLIRT